MFVDLGLSRSLFIKLGVLSQFAGMAAAGGAQWMLFIGNVSVYIMRYIACPHEPHTLRSVQRPTVPSLF